VTYLTHSHIRNRAQICESTKHVKLFIRRNLRPGSATTTFRNCAELAAGGRIFRHHFLGHFFSVIQTSIIINSNQLQTATPFKNCHSNSSEGPAREGVNEPNKKKAAQPPTACQLLQREMQRCHATSIPNGHFFIFSLECFLKQ
jgi:hypothetical protein